MGQCFAIYFNIFMQLLVYRSAFRYLHMLSMKKHGVNVEIIEWDISQISQDVDKAVIKGRKSKEFSCLQILGNLPH